MSALPPSEILALLQELVRTPSVNPTLSSEDGTGEAAIASVAQNWLTTRGISAWQEEVAPGRPNVVAECGQGSGPTLVLCAHIDTVGTQGMTIQPFEPEVTRGRLYGRGSYDMKGGVASVMAAAASLADQDLPGCLMLALVADEEYASLGASAFVKRHTADACILTEPSEEQLVLAHKGFLWAEITVPGYAAHGSRWDLGESAIAKTGPILNTLARFDAEVLRSRTHPLTGPASLHPSMIDGGTGWSTYAPSCTLRVERRTIPGETEADVFTELQDVVVEACPDATIRSTFYRAPSTCSATAPIAASVRHAVQSVRGSEVNEIGVAYWMDAAIFTEAGIPTVNFGSIGAGAHEDIEWVDVDSVVRCARVLAEAAVHYFDAFNTA